MAGAGQGHPAAAAQPRQVPGLRATSSGRSLSKAPRDAAVELVFRFQAVPKVQLGGRKRADVLTLLPRRTTSFSWLNQNLPGSSGKLYRWVDANSSCGWQ